MDVLPSVEDLLERVPSWKGRAVVWQRLAGGLSHHIFRVDVDGIPYVLRVLDPAVSEVGLGIPPEQEIANTVRAAESGVGAQVYDILADVPAIVLEYLPGRTLSNDEVRRPEVVPALAEACRRLHAGALFDNDFDIFAKRRHLLDVCERHDLPLPPEYLDRSSTIDELERALAERPLPSGPCHNDLLAENFIALPVASGDSFPAGKATFDRVRIVDYQLSGNNDPAFELGDIAAEADYDPDRVELLAAAYFGPALTPALLARVRLFLIASNVTWTLWFTVHHGLLGTKAATADFDYAAEAADKWGQARRDLDDPELGRLLDAVTGRFTRRTGDDAPTPTNHEEVP
jgi:thiamine kinase-like enzyme